MSGNISFLSLFISLLASHIVSTEQTVEQIQKENITTELPEECTAVSDGDYDIGIHVGAIFIIMVTSGIGVVLPILGSRSAAFRLNPKVTKIVKCFGSGVILSTGLVHMLLPALETLQSPCLPDFFTKDYSALAAVLALFAVLLMQLVDLYGSHYRLKRTAHHIPRPPDSLVAISPSEQYGAVDVEHDAITTAGAEVPLLTDVNDHCCDTDTLAWMITDPEMVKQKKWSLYVLEFGIAIHSVIIGFALGVTRDLSEFTTLLIALVFHQFFEGFALGALASVIYLTPKTVGTLITLYCLTTPIGVAVGVLLTVYVNPNPNDPSSLIVQGVLDSLSAGILIYTSIVDVLLPDFREHSFHQLDVKWKFGCIAGLWLGAISMSIIAAWA